MKVSILEISLTIVLYITIEMLFLMELRIECIGNSRVLIIGMIWNRMVFFVYVNVDIAIICGLEIREFCSMSNWEN